LGQNFLISQKILNEIADALKIQKNDFIIEIGPGIGNLTKTILKHSPQKLITIEKDKNFCEILKKEFEEYIEQKKLIVINEDILKINFENLLKNYYLQKLHGREVFVDRKFTEEKTEEKKDFAKKEFVKNEFIKKENYKIVGNIPYYLTSRLIRKIFENKILPEKIILTIQKEVAQRICAAQNNKLY